MSFRPQSTRRVERQACHKCSKNMLMATSTQHSRRHLPVSVSSDASSGSKAHCPLRADKLIVHRQYGEPGQSYPTPEDSYVLGLCTGSLAAAAISSCSTLSELLPAAVQTVQVAFRLGMCVVRMRDRIEPPSSDLPREWSIMFSDMEPKVAEAAIRDYCNANVSGLFLVQRAS